MAERRREDPALQDTIVPARILDGLDVGVLTTAADGRLTYVNSAALELLGVDREQLLGRTSYDVGWDVIDPEQHPIPNAQLPTNQALRTGKVLRDVVVGVARPRLRDRMWLLVCATPTRTSSGEVEGVVTTFSDISSRRAFEDILHRSNVRLERSVQRRSEVLEETVKALRAEIRSRRQIQKALAEREARLDTVLDTMSEGVMLLGPDSTILEANPAASRILGAPLEELIGRRATEESWGIVDEDGRPLEMAAIPARITLATGEPIRESIIGVPRPDGTKRWLRVNINPITRGQPDAARGALATFSDITEQHEARRALEHSVNQTRLLLSAAPGLFVYRAVVSPDGSAELVHVSEGCRRVLGIDPGVVPIALTALQDRIHPEDLSAFLPPWEDRHSAEMGPIDAELRMRATSDAAWRWVSVQARPESTPEGLIWSGTVLDVDERRRMAAVLRETQKLEAVGVLAAGVAHNFNNLLAVIIPNLDQALEQADAASEPLLQDALQASRHARELVRQLTVVARKDGSRPDRDVDLTILIRRVIDLFRRGWAGAIDIQTEITVDHAIVRGSEAHLQQVLVNLAVNARDAMANREDPRLVVRLLEIPGGWRLEVEDNGEGMTPTELARLGEPFYTTKGPGRGTGLGVATALGIVRDHGGSIHFQSTEGVGTLVTVSLPSTDPFAYPTPRPVHEPDSSHRPQQQGRLLIVDDEPLVRRAIARQLSRSGYEVSEASDGWAALEHVRNRPTDAVILDVSMPDLSGTEVLKRIAAIRPRLPVILMTGRLHEGLLHLGASAVMQKPVRRERLLETISSMLDPPP